MKITHQLSDGTYFPDMADMQSDWGHNLMYKTDRANPEERH